jgi:hypothetical protein
MSLIIFLLVFLSIISSTLSTIPFLVGLLVAFSVVFRKSWIFYLALIIGIFLDLIYLRNLGFSSLALCIYVFILFLYERKFETRTAAFVFMATFLGSLIYLKIFSFQQIFLSALLNAIFAAIFFKLLWLKSAPRSEIT